MRNHLENRINRKIDLKVFSHAQLILSPSSAKLTARKINWGKYE